jgi:hypothetical protein
MRRSFGERLHSLEQLGGRQDRSFLVVSQGDEVGITGNDRLGPGGDGAGENRIVIRVLSNDRTEGDGHNDRGAFAEPLNHGSGIEADFGKLLRKLLPLQHAFQFFEKRAAREEPDDAGCGGLENP